MDNGFSLLADAPDPKARAEWRLYWSSKTGVERLAGMTPLTRQARKLQGTDVYEEIADWTVWKVRLQSAADELAGVSEIITKISGR